MFVWSHVSANYNNFNCGGVHHDFRSFVLDDDKIVVILTDVC